MVPWSILHSLPVSVTSMVVISFCRVLLFAPTLFFPLLAEASGLIPRSLSHQACLSYFFQLRISHLFLNGETKGVPLFSGPGSRAAPAGPKMTHFGDPQKDQSGDLQVQIQIKGSTGCPKRVQLSSDGPNGPLDLRDPKPEDPST